MKKTTLFTFVLLFAGLRAFSQCTPQAVYPSSAWAIPSAPTTPYNGFMCQGYDTLFTRAGWAYYDGDGYFVKLIAGSQVVIYADSCTGNPVSLTVVDSTGGNGGAGNPIPGAFAAAACPNSLNFTAPYTGIYFIVFDTDSNCSNLGAAAVGTSAIKLLNDSVITNCNPIAAPANDSICAAIPITLGTTYGGTTVYASPTDARDAEVTASGYNCSAPNNTLWYSFSPSVTGDYELISNSPAVGGASLWYGIFEGTGCNDPLFYVDCLTGSEPAFSPYSDTVSLTAGFQYYIMVDGFSGSTGIFDFSLNLLTTGVNEISMADFNVYPNPFRDEITISNKSNMKDFNVEIFTVTGQLVYNARINNLVNQVIDTRELAKGMYTIRFTNDNGTINRKLVKE